MKYLDNPYWKSLSYLKIKSINKIGIIDGGYIDRLVSQKNIFGEKSFTYYESNVASIENSAKHGTIVANIITDISPGSQLYIAKVLGDEDKRCGINAEQKIISALEWLVEQEVDIINISLGTYHKCDGHCDLAKVIEGISKNTKTIVVVSAGNIGKNHLINESENYISCPGCANYAISVGALDMTGNLDNSINLKNDFVPSKPDVFVNGHICFDINQDGQFYNYEVAGTSFSAPIIVGLLSYGYEYVKNENNDTIISTLNKDILVTEKIKNASV